MNETRDITNPTRDRIRTLGIPCERVNSGSVRVRGGYLHGWGKGSADLVGWLPPRGRMFAIETKTQVGKLNEHQEKWRDMVRKQGVLYHTARSVGEAIKVVLKWAAEERERK